MIRVTNLTKTFGDTKALDNCNVHIPKGAVYGLVGPNGAGKSTLIRHLAGIYRQDSGEVLVDGQPVFDNPAAKGKFAYIPDDVFYFRNANLKEMAKFYKSVYPTFDMALYEKLVAAFNLDPKKSLSKFSKGMVKQAAFLLSLSVRPELLILDEPVDGLDPVMRRQVWSIMLQDVAERNMTVLVSSHNLRELEDVCDYVGIMHQGKMLLEQSLSQMQENLLKVQVVFGETRPENLPIVHSTQNGRIETLILSGSPEELQTQLEAANPILLELMPLSLEEIFIYELGGVSYDIKSILL